jgi:putative PIN family toxin of toxin-antitoxin system
VRVVFDANVLVSALLSRTGKPAELVRRWLEGEFDLVVCEELLAETERTLRSPKLRGRFRDDEVERFVATLRDLGQVVPDPEGPPPVHSSDPDDDYLLALAARERTPLVTGDRHLLQLRDRAPVHSPADFDALLGR